MDRKNLRPISEILEEYCQKKWGTSVYELKQKLKSREENRKKLERDEEEYLYK